MKSYVVIGANGLYVSSTPEDGPYTSDLQHAQLYSDWEAREKLRSEPGGRSVSLSEARTFTREPYEADED